MCPQSSHGLLWKKLGSETRRNHSYSRSQAFYRQYWQLYVFMVESSHVKCFLVCRQLMAHPVRAFHSHLSLYRWPRTERASDGPFSSPEKRPPAAHGVGVGVRLWGGRSVWCLFTNTAINDLFLLHLWSPVII